VTFLLDTNVVSELRKTSARIDRRVADWARHVAASHQFVSAITLFELELGVLRVERRDPAQGRVLRHWLEAGVESSFTGRILPLDAAVARRAAALHVPDPKPERDSYIAATALINGLTVVTRNVADFEPMGVDVLDPWN
jgi:toxin FitB